MNKEIIDRLASSLKNVSKDLNAAMNNLSNEISKSDNPELKKQQEDIQRAVHCVKTGDIDTVMEIHKRYADKIN
jgi:archaellum component FlaC|tara:strand:+ start:1997 stop:2218 length:222 start_codon:yes stop_codon:yes gene_type:complete